MKAGKVYLQIAGKALDTWYSDMYMSQRTAILVRADFAELEGFLDMKSSIENACFAIRCELERGDVFLPQNFAETVLYNDTPKGDLGAAIESIRNRRFFEAGKGEIAMRAIEMVHDGWVMKNSSKFFDKSRADKRFMFLRTELIGFDEAMEYMLFVEPILTLLELKPDAQYLRTSYREAGRQLAEIYGIKNVEDLVRYIRRADYRPLTGAIATAMDDPVMARFIANQVIEHGGNPW